MRTEIMIYSACELFLFYASQCDITCTFVLYVLWWIKSPLRACCVSATLKKREAPTKALRDSAIWSVQRQMRLALPNYKKKKAATVQQVGAVVTVLVSKFFSACMKKSVYLGANQSVEPLDRLHVPNDAIHPVYVEHDLAQG